MSSPTTSDRTGAITEDPLVLRPTSPFPGKALPSANHRSSHTVWRVSLDETPTEDLDLDDLPLALEGSYLFG